MLAHGISVSMYTTALGLIVAIPAMVAYSFLVSRQNHLTEEITEKSGKLTELLTSSHIPGLTKEHVYGEGHGTKSGKTPPPSAKAS